MRQLREKSQKRSLSHSRSLVLVLVAAISLAAMTSLTLTEVLDLTSDLVLFAAARLTVQDKTTEFRTSNITGYSNEIGNYNKSTSLLRIIANETSYFTFLNKKA